MANKIIKTTIIITVIIPSLTLPPEFDGVRGCNEPGLEKLQLYEPVVPTLQINKGKLPGRLETGSQDKVNAVVETLHT